MGISKVSVDRDLSCILRSITGLFRGFRVCFVGVEFVVEFRAVKVLVLSFMASSNSVSSTHMEHYSNRQKLGAIGFSQRLDLSK